MTELGRAGLGVITQGIAEVIDQLDDGGVTKADRRVAREEIVAEGGGRKRSMSVAHIERQRSGTKELEQGGVDMVRGLTDTGGGAGGDWCDAIADGEERG